MTTAVRKGNQNPTQSVKIKYKKTFGDLAIASYNKARFKAFPWQENIVKDILAVRDDGLWTHTKIGFAVPRRNGKNEIVLIRELYALENGETVLHTAHRVPTSHTAWEKLVRHLNNIGYVEDEDFTTLKAKGNERIEFIKTGGRVEFRTRTSTGGLGEGFDVLIIDEAQEYTEDQESALKYITSASQNPQTILCGTPPTMVSSGTVFMELRETALSGNSEDTAWYEWSISEAQDPNDTEFWYQANPSLGHLITERNIRQEITSDDLDFNVQRLGYWVKYNQQSAITESDWEAIKVNSLPLLKGGVNVGIKYGKDGKNVSMAIAIKTLSNRVFIEVLDCRPIRDGNQWIINWLLALDLDNVIIDGAGFQSLLASDMEEYKLPKPILPTVKEVIIANSKFEQAIFSKDVFHNNQPSLTEVVTNSEKRNIGSQGGFGFKSQYEDKDITIMDSAILAYYICSEQKQPKKKQQVYY